MCLNLESAFSLGIKTHVSTAQPCFYRRQAIGVVLLAMPSIACASDMTILLFLFSFPACLVLVAVALIMSAFLKPSLGWLLALPMGGLVAINLYMVPHMQHGDEQIAFLIQLAVSASSLFSIRIIKRNPGSAPARTKDSSPDINKPRDVSTESSTDSQTHSQNPR